jgi:hypothetical protein
LPFVNIDYLRSGHIYIILFGPAFNCGFLVSINLDTLSGIHQQQKTQISLGYTGIFVNNYLWKLSRMIVQFTLRGAAPGLEDVLLCQTEICTMGVVIADTSLAEIFSSKAPF